jgi:hypothetical protein
MYFCTGLLVNKYAVFQKERTFFREAICYKSFSIQLSQPKWPVFPMGPVR